MKKNTVFSIGLVLGLFLIAGFINDAIADDHQEKVARRPVSVQNLPEDVREAIQEDYEGFRIVGAIMVTRNGDGAEGTQQQDTERQRETDMEREGTQQRDPQREGAETQREGTQAQREGAEAQREGTQAQREGAETQRGTQREGAEAQRDDEIRVERDRDQQGTRQRDDDNDNDRGGLFEGVFTDEDTYYELTIESGNETKVVRYDKNGNELEVDKRDKDDNR